MNVSGERVVLHLRNLPSQFMTLQAVQGDQDIGDCGMLCVNLLYM